MVGSQPANTLKPTLPRGGRPRPILPSYNADIGPPYRSFIATSVQNSRKRHRPKMQIATIAATMLVLAGFSILARGSVLMSHQALLDAMQPADEHMRPAPPVVRIPLAIPGFNSSRVFALRAPHVVDGAVDGGADAAVDPDYKKDAQSIKPTSQMPLTATHDVMDGKQKSAYGTQNSTSAKKRNLTNAPDVETNSLTKDTEVPPQLAQVLAAADGSRYLVGGSNVYAITAIEGRQPSVLHALHDRIGSRDANLAFFLQISDSSLPLLLRLLVIMWHPRNQYVIHFDTKIPNYKTNAFAKSIAATQKFSNVHLLEREPITYKGISMLLNTLSAIEYLLSKHASWDYFINLSGSDYPLVNVASMRRILGQPKILDRNVSFMQVATSKDFWDRMRHSRFDFIYYDTAVGMKNMTHELLHTWMGNPVKEEVGVEFLQAEAWIIAHRSFAEFSVRSSFSRKLLILLSAMQDPEEHYFPMLAWNSPKFNKTFAHHAFRGIFWDYNGTMAGQHPYYVDELDNNKYKFWDSHILSSQCFFARKFRWANSPLMERIDQRLSGTHAESDVGSVVRAFKIVHKYVSCISDIDPRAPEIRSYNICR